MANMLECGGRAYEAPCIKLSKITVRSRAFEKLSIILNWPVISLYYHLVGSGQWCVCRMAPDPEGSIITGHEGQTAQADSTFPRY